MGSAVGQRPAALLLIAFELPLLGSQMFDLLFALGQLDAAGVGLAAGALADLVELGGTGRGVSAAGLRARRRPASV